MVLAIALSMKWVQNEMPQLQEIGGVIGTTVSGSFLIIIGLVNLVVLFNLYQVFRKMRTGRFKKMRSLKSCSIPEGCLPE